MKRKEQTLAFGYLNRQEYKKMFKRNLNLKNPYVVVRETPTRVIPQKTFKTVKQAKKFINMKVKKHFINKNIRIK